MSQTRRNFLKYASVASVTALAGCSSLGGGGSSKSVARPATIGISTDYPMCTSRRKGMATVSQDTSGENSNPKVVTIEGRFIQRGTCKTVRFESFSYDSKEDVATIVIGTQEKQFGDECQDCIAAINYRLRVEFETLPGEVEIQHKGVENAVVKTTSLSG